MRFFVLCVLAPIVMAGDDNGDNRAKRARNLGIASDTLTLGEKGVNVGFGIAKFATNLGFGIASKCILAPAAALEYAAGPNAVSAGLTSVDGVVGLAHSATRAGQDLAHDIAKTSLAVGKAGLAMAGAEEGQLLRLAIGDEAAETVSAIEDMVRQYVEPLSNVPTASLLASASAWSAAQQAAGVAAAGTGQVADLPEHVERYVRFAAATMGSAWLAGLVDVSPDAFVRFCNVNGGGPGERALAWAGVEGPVEILEFQESTGQLFRPGYMVAVDHVTNRVVVALRGTSSVRDVLVDLACKPAELQLAGLNGTAHSGMLKAAREVGERLAAVADQGLARLAAAGHAPRLLVTGHSLGAGVGALLTALWRDEDRFPGVEVSCLAFACPQVLDLQLSQAVSNFITSFVVGDDVVPRFSLAMASDLRAATLHIHDPEAHGIPQTFAAENLLASAARGETQQLAEAHAALRRAACNSPGRLFPPGRLVFFSPGRAPELAEPMAFDELLISSDMVRAHMPQRYLKAIREAQAG